MTIKISIKVITHAKKSEVVADEIDLLGVRILKIKISQPPEDGKANKAMIELLAEYFNVKENMVTIIAGEKLTHKIVEIK